MRIIDQLAIRSATPLPPEELRTADGPTLQEQRNAHFIALARFMADCGANGVDDLKASQKREYDKRMRAINTIAAATPSTSTLHAAKLRLISRSPNV